MLCSLKCNVFQEPDPDVNSIMKRLRRVLELLAWTAFFSFAALVLALRFWILPQVEQYRPEIIATATRALGAPVKIGAIEAGWLGLRPQVRLYDVRIQDAQGRDALVPPGIQDGIALRSVGVRPL